MSRKDSQRTEKLPPHSLESEQGCLGCVLCSPDKAAESMMLLIQKFPGPEVFYTLALRTVYEVLLVMHDERAPIDILTLQQRLKDKNLLNACGGLEYLASLPDGVPSASNLDYYADIVFGKFKLRSMIQGCTEIVGRIYDDEETALDKLELFHRDLVRLSQMTNRKKDWSVKEAVKGAISKIERDIKSGGALTGLPTGFRELDKNTRGFQRGEFIVIGARPSMGKSTIAMNFAEHWAVNNRIPVGVFSIEMSKESLMSRMISARTRINLFSIENDLLADQELLKIHRTGGELAAAPLYIEDAPGIDDVDLRSMIRQMVHEYGIQAAVIDYFQLLRARRRFDSRVLELSHISTSLKNLARELKIAVVMVAQLNREADAFTAKGERPRISHLKDCGGLEQDADLIGLLYPTAKPDDDDAHGNAVPSAIDIAKQRNGPTGPIRLVFHKPIFRFDTASKISDADVPKDPRMKDP